MRVKPQEGKIVRNPLDGSRIPSGGRNVPNNSFWRRRLAAGDVVPAEAPQPVQVKAPAEESAVPTRGSRSRSKD